jgi:hypothetical protein
MADYLDGAPVNEAEITSKQNVERRRLKWKRYEDLMLDLTFTFPATPVPQVAANSAGRCLADPP